MNSGSNYVSFVSNLLWKDKDKCWQALTLLQEKFISVGYFSNKDKKIICHWNKKKSYWTSSKLNKFTTPCQSWEVKKMNENKVTSTLTAKCPANWDSPRKDIVCYYSGQRSATTLDACLCTHLIYNNIGINENNHIVLNNGEWYVFLQRFFF